VLTVFCSPIRNRHIHREKVTRIKPAIESQSRTRGRGIRRYSRRVEILRRTVGLVIWPSEREALNHRETDKTLDDSHLDGLLDTLAFRAGTQEIVHRPRTRNSWGQWRSRTWRRQLLTMNMNYPSWHLDWRKFVPGQEGLEEPNLSQRFK
jgi:hypothetical protein